MVHVYNKPARQYVEELLKLNNLPTDDLDSVNLDLFLGCGDTSNKPKGIVGLEIHGKYGLLRSLVVHVDARNSGCGKLLVVKIEQLAQQKQLKTLYLLTNTAEKFFTNLNYEKVERLYVPRPIRETREFATLCPESAIVMRKNL